MNDKKKTVDDLFKEVDSRYALVNAVAQRAREISDIDEESGGTLVEKPVLLVLEELEKGDAKIVRADSVQTVQADGEDQ